MEHIRAPILSLARDQKVDTNTKLETMDAQVVPISLDNRLTIQDLGSVPSGHLLSPATPLGLRDDLPEIESLSMLVSSQHQHFHWCEQQGLTRGIDDRRASSFVHVVSLTSNGETTLGAAGE